MNSKTIALDFDGTCVYHDWPNIETIPGSVEVLKELVKAGHKLILYTMRSDNEDKHSTFLLDAISWFRQNGINLYGIQTHPAQLTWTKSPKCHADLCIDDRNLGQPCLYEVSRGRFVDWNETRKLLDQLGYFQKEELDDLIIKEDVEKTT